MGFVTAEASFSIKTEDIMTDNGRKIKCMAGVNCFMKEASLLIKEIGHMTSFMDMVKYTMTTPLSLKEDLTTLTLICLTTIGYFMKAC